MGTLGLLHVGRHPVHLSLRAPTQNESAFERLIFPLDGVRLHRPSSDGLLRLPCQRHETLALGATIILRRGSQCHEETSSRGRSVGLWVMGHGSMRVCGSSIEYSD